MIIAAISWPEAVVEATGIAALALVISVLVWSIFRTGQTAIRHEPRQREELETLRAEVDELRGRLERSPSGGAT